MCTRVSSKKGYLKAKASNILQMETISLVNSGTEFDKERVSLSFPMEMSMMETGLTTNRMDLVLSSRNSYHK